MEGQHRATGLAGEFSGHRKGLGWDKVNWLYMEVLYLRLMYEVVVW